MGCLTGRPASGLWPQDTCQYVQTGWAVIAKCAASILRLSGQPTPQRSVTSGHQALTTAPRVQPFPVDNAHLSAEMGVLCV